MAWCGREEKNPSLAKPYYRWHPDRRNAGGRGVYRASASRSTKARRMREGGHGARRRGGAGEMKGSGGGGRRGMGGDAARRSGRSGAGEWGWKEWDLS